MQETANLLAKMGCEVHIVAGEPHKGQIAGEQVDDGKLKVSRVKLIKYAGRGKWNYIAHYLSFMFAAIKSARRHPGQFDVIWASSPPLFTGIAGLVISRFKKAKLCLDIRDIWPESAVVAGQIKADSMLFKCAKLVEHVLYRAADQITCVARPMAEYIEKLSGGRKPTIIYNAIPEKMVAEKALPADTCPEVLNILYIGNMGYCQNLGLVVEAARILASENETRINFQLVGNGIEKPLIESAVRDAGLKNVEIMGLVSKEMAISMIRNAHALMLHLKDDGTMDKTIPSKVFDYMAGGRPILYGLKGEACDILRSVSGNLYYDPSDPAQLAAQARYLLKNYAELADSAVGNLTEVRANFLREGMAKKLLRVFESMTGKNQEWKNLLNPIDK
jgi:glycosyltransferase involved in cell wall biosynthesis